MFKRVPDEGSPPPMRGKVLRLPFMWAATRITPAYAGKSCMQHTALGWCWDHPRLCGEKFSEYGNASSCIGSPPPMRGKVVYLVTNTLGIRITPAYAGKSLLCSTKRLYNKDHPRLCGEKLKHMIKNTGGKGSPPPMRGKAING